MEAYQFEGTDSQLSRDLASDQASLLETRGIIVRKTGMSGGNLAQGVQPTKTYVLIECPGQMKMMDGKDIISGGGLYAYGDIQWTSQMPIFGPNNRTQTNTDFMIFDGKDYEQVGTPFPVPMAGGFTFYKTTWRRQA